ncbi:MAG TPA: type II toxin-antitoxin system RelE/ParE family toxin [Terriglobia bacterium]|nr:type II toxin-antitoxin system RelE/ParE family toxin [Terriglobia bacterium]
MRRFIFHVLAERELNDAVDFYEGARSGLGSDFVDDVEHALGQIDQFPESGYLLNGSVRRLLLRRFPYALMYSVRPGEIRILAIAHLKRRPFYWRGRQ